MCLAAVLLLTSLGITAAILSRTVERRKEISLMQTLGAKRSFVAIFLLLENGVAGVAASVAGFVAGTILSGVVARQVFHVPVDPSPGAFAGTLIITIGMALLAGGVGAGRALKIEPAVVLKGE